MAFNIISAAEAATYIKHGYNVGLSGFTPAGSPKAVTPEIAKIAEAEHAGLVAATGKMTADQKLQMQANLGYATENWVTDQINSLTVLDEEVF